MAVTLDNSTLIVAESYGKRLTAFDIAEDGTWSNWRVWAGLGDGVPMASGWTPTTPSGTVPTSVAYVSAKGVRLPPTIKLDRGCFAYMLGGADKRKLFTTAAQWRGPAKMGDDARMGHLLTTLAPPPGVA
jgi:sugar lactone lactonase YvrE